MIFLEEARILNLVLLMITIIISIKIRILDVITIKDHKLVVSSIIIIIQIIQMDFLIITNKIQIRITTRITISEAFLTIIRVIPKIIIKIRIHFLEIKTTKINKTIVFLITKTNKIVVFFNKIIINHSKVKTISRDNSKIRPPFSIVTTIQMLIPFLITKTKILLTITKTIPEVVVLFLTSNNLTITNKIFGIIIQIILILFSAIINNLTWDHNFNSNIHTILW